MRLVDTLDFSQDNIAPKTLANEGDDFAGLDNSYIIGWGTTGKNIDHDLENNVS